MNTCLLLPVSRFCEFSESPESLKPLLAVVVVGGLKPPTSFMSSKHSNQLSYAPPLTIFDWLWLKDKQTDPSDLRQ